MALRINTVPRLKPPTQERCSKQLSAATLKLGATENGRERDSPSQGVTVTESFKERKALNVVLKTKHQKRNKMRSMNYAECLTLNWELIVGLVVEAKGRMTGLWNDMCTVYNALRGFTSWITVLLRLFACLFVCLFNEGNDLIEKKSFREVISTSRWHLQKELWTVSDFLNAKVTTKPAEKKPNGGAHGSKVGLKHFQENPRVSCWMCKLGYLHFFPFVYNHVHSLFPYNLCFRPYINEVYTLDSL